MLNQMDKNKKSAGEAAANYVQSGMTIGLGSGSTVNWMLKKLGERIKEESLEITGIPSSRKTENLAKELGIPLADLSSEVEIDLAIDGADEVDVQLNLLKGGGGSLVREKLVDVAAKKLIIIVDESKVVSQLGEFSLPVEILPFGWEVTAKRISELNCVPTLRKEDNTVFISDNGNYILDCKFEEIPRPEQLHEKLKLLVGVVETGLFTGMTDKVIVGRSNGVEELN